MSSFVSNFLFDSNQLIRIVASLENCDALYVVESPVLDKNSGLRSMKAPAFIIIEVSAIICLINFS